MLVPILLIWPAFIIIVIIFVGVFYLGRYEASDSSGKRWNKRFGKSCYYLGIVVMWWIQSVLTAGLFICVYALLGLPASNFIIIPTVAVAYLISTLFMYYANKAGSE